MNRKLVIGVVTAALTAMALAACGGTSRRPGEPALASLHAGTTASEAQVCMPKSARPQAGDPPPGNCVLTLPDGNRYQCPAGVAQKLGSGAGAGADAATRNPACRKLAPLRVPRSWRPALRRMTSVTACLERAGIDAAGGSLAGFQTYPDVPAGSLLISGATRPTEITFYPTQAGAAQAFVRVRGTVAASGGSVARLASVLVVWPRDVSSGRKAVERDCVQRP